MNAIYVDAVFTLNGNSSPITMYMQYGWSGEQVESVWRNDNKMFQGRIEIPSLNYKSEQNSKGEKKVYNADGIGDEHQALWCEVAKHSFSAKDADKVLMNARGESRLACGPCSMGLFGVEDAAGAKEVEAG